MTQQKSWDWWKESKTMRKYKFMYKLRDIDDSWKTYRECNLSSDKIATMKLIDLRLGHPDKLFCVIPL
jgi:hypothetical protein